MHRVRDIQSSFASQSFNQMNLSGDCLESVPSSAASEDAIDLPEPFVTAERLQDLVTLLLEGIGEDLQREGLQDTPKRVAKAWLSASEGYSQSVHSVLGGALFHDDMSSRRNTSMVLIRDVDFASTSEHNLLPFFGRCHIAYIPRQGVVLGLSKVARLAKMFAKRFQDQQRLTCQLLEAFNAEVQPLGCAAIVEAVHLGSDPASTHLTSASLGSFCAQPEVFMQEFAILLGRPDLVGSPGLRQDMLACTAGDRICYSSCSAPVSADSDCSSLGDAEEDETMECSTSGRMTAAVEAMLREVGEDTRRQGLKGSAQRYVQHLLASTSRSAHGQDIITSIDTSRKIAESLSSWQIESLQSFHMRFTSQCEHHLLPFHGTIQKGRLHKKCCLQIVYCPSQPHQKLKEDIIRQILDRYSKRLQIQERLTHQIGHAIQCTTESRGLLVVCRAAHMCMVARGVEQHASTTMTSVAYGLLQHDHALRAASLQCLQNVGPIHC